MNIAEMIDHTILNPDAKIEDIKRICLEAKEYGFASVCVNPAYVSLCKESLKGSSVKVCTVIGFPLGANTISTKAYEAHEAVLNGADEIDMVQNVTMAKEHDWKYIENEVRAVKEACDGRLLKVILETCFLTKDEIKESSFAAMRGNADFVKTSTGFGKGGAKAEDIKIMREAVGKDKGVKASGGIHSYEEAKALIDAGASRIGASKSIDIVKGEKE